MLEYKGDLEHFVVIQCDHDNAEKIKDLLDESHIKTIVRE